METKAKELTDEERFVTVPESYLEELAKNAEDVEWYKGYAKGLEDAFAYMCEVLRAKSGRSE